jgi:DNA-binding response OmpR family regulator
MKDKRTLLIIDDDRQMGDMLGEYFADDFHVLKAADGADALLLAVDRRPELIILDVNLPLLDGRTVCSKLKGYYGTKDIKIVMLSGRGDHNDRIVGFEAGADDYLEKPCSLAYVKRSVENCLRQRRSGMAESEKEGIARKRMTGRKCEPERESSSQ